MRLALGCMRLSTEADRDDARALATVRAALDAGVVVLDTAHAYGRDETELGHNERLVAAAVKAHRNGAAEPAAAIRIVTKCGMRRGGGAWIPDARARRIAEDVAGSQAALGGLTIDTVLLHAPDPRTSLATAGRALARIVERGQARRVGVSNVSRKELEELRQHAPITAVEIALGAHDDLALRNGVVSYCLANGIELFGHAPLGGAKRVERLARDGALARIGGAHGVGGADVLLAYLLRVSAALVPVVGARSPATIARWVRVEQLVLTDEELLALDARFPRLAAWRCPPVAAAMATAARRPAREVVLMMGVPGAGKSTAAQAFVARGYTRFNRDTLGGTLRGIVKRLDEHLAAGGGDVVLDNTYVTRATRHDVVHAARRHGAGVRCVFFDTPRSDAQINAVLRMLARFGHVLGPAELAVRAKEDPAALGPGAIDRMLRDLERPADDEGFTAIETVPFVRRSPDVWGRATVAVSLDVTPERAAAMLGAFAHDAPALLFGWRPCADDAHRERALATAATAAAALTRTTGRPFDVALCTHAPGPPVCWCRPPLPGAWLGFAHRVSADPRTSVLIGGGPSMRALAQALGLRRIDADPQRA